MNTVIITLEEGISMKCNKCGTEGFFKNTKRLAEVTGVVVGNFCIECNKAFGVSRPKIGIKVGTK